METGVQVFAFKSVFCWMKKISRTFYTSTARPSLGPKILRGWSLVPSGCKHPDPEVKNNGNQEIFSSWIQWFHQEFFALDIIIDSGSILNFRGVSRKSMMGNLGKKNMRKNSGRGFQRSSRWGSRRSKALNFLINVGMHSSGCCVAQRKSCCCQGLKLETFQATGKGSREYKTKSNVRRKKKMASPNQ